MRKIFIFNKGYNVRATVEVEYMTEGEEKRLSICGTLYAPNIRCKAVSALTTLLNT